LINQMMSALAGPHSTASKAPGKNRRQYRRRYGQPNFKISSRFRMMFVIHDWAVSVTESSAVSKMAAVFRGSLLVFDVH